MTFVTPFGYLVAFAPDLGRQGRRLFRARRARRHDRGRPGLVAVGPAGAVRPGADVAHRRLPTS
ncbi:MAG: hypothetical protein WDO24_09720 [Pseudomonadota bacterium]